MLGFSGRRILESRSPVAVDLFSGAGGLAEGLESVGIRVAAATELHPQPALTHALNHAHTRVFAGDIRKIEFERLREAVEDSQGSDQVDIVVGGPPCQGFSTAGKKQADDPRNDLFLEFVRAVAFFRPSMFLLENVPGFKNMHGGAAYRAAKEAFEGQGYVVSDTILQAADYGTPQRRRRFVMVGRRPERVASFVWPERTHELAEHGDRLFALMPYRTTGEALEDLAFLEPGWEAHRYPHESTSEYARARRNGSDLLFNHLATKHREKAIQLFSMIPEGESVASLPLGLRPKKVTMARMSRCRVSNAVLALPDDMIHYAHHRIPTVREMARLQSFDDDYVFLGKRTSGFKERRVDVPQYTQVGNAVPPLLARALGRALLKSLALPQRDLRDLDARRARNVLVRGTSGFSGYTLSPEATAGVALYDALGDPLPLPIDADDVPVSEHPLQVEWAKRGYVRRPQWVPPTDGSLAVAAT